MIAQWFSFAAPLLRGAFQWLFATLLAVSLIGLFFVINALQLTAPDTAQRVLARAVADLTEVDALLPTIQADLADEVETSEEPTVTVPLFPIPVELDRDEAKDISTAELRSRLLDQAAEAMYEHGMSVFALGDPEAEQHIDIFSPEGGIQRGLDLLSDNNHNALRIAAIVLGLTSLILAGLVLLSTQGFGRVVAVGAALLGAAVPSLMAAVAVRFFFRSAREDQSDYLLFRLLDLGNDAMWLPLRNYTILTLVGLMLVLLGLILVLFETRQRAVYRPPSVDKGSTAD